MQDFDLHFSLSGPNLALLHPLTGVVTPDTPPYSQQATVVEMRITEALTGALIGASLARVEPGYVEITLPYRDDLTQQKGFVHGGILGMIADTACGYSAFSLMPGSSW